MRAQVDNPNALMESIHLKQFYDEQARQQYKAIRGEAHEKQAHTAERATFRAGQLDKLSGSRTEKIKKLTHDDAVHAALLKRKEDVEREELRVELALSEKARR